jgi:hypothetical protein
MPPCAEHGNNFISIAEDGAGLQRCAGRAPADGLGGHRPASSRTGAGVGACCRRRHGGQRGIRIEGFGSSAGTGPRYRLGSDARSGRGGTRERRRRHGVAVETKRGLAFYAELRGGRVGGMALRTFHKVGCHAGWERCPDGQIERDRTETKPRRAILHHRRRMCIFKGAGELRMSPKPLQGLPAAYRRIRRSLPNGEFKSYRSSRGDIKEEVLALPTFAINN